ncbi:MAG: M20/M25/M40 family metallo-hydrolase [Bacteroidales bacterium]|nr:M20/M25/M40 family metallo-hydrolase [Bacteroidales bacterium]
MKNPALSFLIPAVVAVCFLSCSCTSGDASCAAEADPLISGAVARVSPDSIRTYIEDLVGFHTRHTLSTQTDPGKGIGAAVNYLVGRCGQWAGKSSGVRPEPVVEVIHYTAGEKGGRYDRVIQAPQLMVTLPGTKGEREILLSAHIDTRVADVMDSTSFAPGANDDGSGLACLLEVVRILSEIPLEQTVKCLFVSGEEQGLDGSSYMASLAAEEGWPVMAMINNDMIGNAVASGTGLKEDHKVRVFSESRSGEDSDPRQLARYVKETAGTYVPAQEVKLIYRNDRYRRSGDHTPFLRKGFTAVRMSEYCENYDRTHQDVRTEDGIDYGDMLSGVDIPCLARNIQINLATVMNLAQAPDKPANARIANAGELANNTVIAWDPVAAGEGSGTSVSYQILCRETDQPVWEVLGTVDGSCTEFSCPLSKDNYFFAVRAVSATGNPGLPAIAR